MGGGVLWFAVSAESSNAHGRKTACYVMLHMSSELWEFVRTGYIGLGVSGVTGCWVKFLGRMVLKKSGIPSELLVQ